MKPVVYAESSLTMNSREIAELTRKRHSDVMRDIRKMMGVLENAEMLSLIKSTTYRATNGIRYKQYSLGKDETYTLLLGYDAVARMKVVKRWQELENRQQYRIPQTFAEALRALAGEVEKGAELKNTIAAQNAKIIEDAPKVAFTDSIAACDTSISIERFAKLYKPVKMGRNKMFALLRELKILRKNNVPYQKVMHHFELMEYPLSGGLLRTKTLVRPQGQVYLANRLDKHFNTEGK